MAAARVTQDTPIWLPRRGSCDLAVWQVQQAVEQYDERLVVGRNEDNGQWCVFMRMMPGGDWPELYPILGLTDHPHDPRHLDPQRVVQQLWNADAVRHGDEILDQLIRTQDAYRNQFDAAASEGAGKVAEVLELIERREGRGSVRVYVPGGDRVVAV